MRSTLASFSITSMHGVPTLVLAGEIGLESCPELRGVLESILQEGDSRLLLDFHAVDYIDGGCIGLIWALFRASVDTGWMGVIGANANIRRILSICGFTEDDTFRLFETRAAVEVALAEHTVGSGACAGLRPQRCLRRGHWWYVDRTDGGTGRTARGASDVECWDE